MNNKKESILTVAEQLFASVGYKKISIDEITKKANIGKGTFYLYFKNKDDLYNQIFENYFFHRNKKNILQGCQTHKELKIRLYADFIGGIYFLSRHQILKEIFLENPNYISESVTIQRLEKYHEKLIKSFFDKEKKKIRNDLDFKKYTRIYRLLIKALQNKAQNNTEFWDFAQTMGKVFVDGILSTDEWGCPHPEKIINHIEKHLSSNK